MSEFSQLCVWPAVMLVEEGQEISREEAVKAFESFMKDEFGVRIKFDTEVKTLPDVIEGREVEGTGGRNDLLFYVHDEDISMFAVPRLKAGIRWWEDVVKYNDNAHLYTEEFRKTRPCQW